MNTTILSPRNIRGLQFCILLGTAFLTANPGHAQDLLTQYKQSIQFPYSDPEPASCARAGTLDFVAMSNQGGGLLICDNSNPQLLKPIGFYGGESMQPSGIAVSGNLAIMGDWDSGIHLLDVTDPENPSLIIYFGGYNSTDPLNTVFDVWIQGNLCIVFAGLEVYVVDITTPATPAIVGRLAHTFQYAKGVHSGNQVFFAAGEQGLQILDFSNPAAPSIVGGLPFTDQYTQSIVLDGTTAYLGLGDSVAIVDVANVSNPVLISSPFLLPFAGAEYLGKVGDALYAIFNQEIYTLDVADPNQVTAVGSTTRFLGQVADVKSANDQLILLTTDGYKLFDATEEFAPKLLSRFDQWNRVSGMAGIGDYLAFVRGFAGFGFADISQNFPFVNQILDTGGYMTDVAANASHAFVAAGTRGLQVIDLSDPQSPGLLTTLALSGFAWGVDLAGTTAYVAIDDQGIVAVDVSIPNAPVIMDTLLLPGNALDVTAAASRVYVSCYSAGVQVVDVSNPASLSVIGAFDTDGRAHRTQLSGNTLYVANGPGGIVILDVTIPASPVLIQKIPTVQEIRDVAINESGWTLLLGDSLSPFEILDVSEPTRPKLHPTTQFVTGALNSARLVNGDIYLGGTFLDSYSIDPNPTFSSVFTWPGHPSGQPHRMACDTGHLYLAGGMAGLVIYDLADPGEPVFASHYSGGEFDSYTDVILHEGLAYLSGNNGVEIVDVSNPYFPRKVGSIPLELGVKTVKIHNGHAYVSQQEVGVGIYDLTDPIDPVQIGFYQFEFGTITGMEFLSGYGYFCAGYSGMIVMDLSDLTNPTAIFVEDFDEGVVWDVQLEGDVLYVSTDSAVKVISVQNPQVPIVIAPAEIYGSQQQLHVVGSTAYTADSVYGMVIVDASVPSVPLISSSTLVQDGGAFGIRICGNFAYVSGSTQLQAFDISTPASPSLTKVIPMNAGHEIVVKSGDVVVAGGDNLNPNGTLSIFMRQEGDWAFKNLIISESPQAMQFVGNILYVASFGRIYIYDLVDSLDPQLLSDFDAVGTGVNAMDVNGNHLYLACNGGVYIHDITDLEAPAPRGSWTSTVTPSDIIVSGNHAFVADSFNGLQVLDVSNPLSPVPVTVIQPQLGGVYQLSLDGSRLLAMGQDSAVLIDVSDPTSPAQIGYPFYASLGGISDGVLEGDTVFFASGEGVESVNVSDTSSGWVPQIGSHVAPPTLSTLIRDNGETYAGGSGLRVLQDVVIQPTLSITRDGLSLELNWSPTGGGFQLEHRPAPGEGSWETVPFTQPPYFDNFTELRRIYRLRR